MLTIEGLNAGYANAPVLRDVALTAQAGEITVVMGRNGAGKTTLMKSIMGIGVRRTGAITLDGAPLAELPPHRIPRAGVGYVPQGRRLFTDLSVAQNLEIGLMAAPADPVRRAALRADALALFPRLTERLSQRAGTLSGGEQQMLATARALCVGPRLMLLDEPTEGLQPSMVEAIRQVMITLRDRGMAVLLVEQRIEVAQALADRIEVIETGRNAALFEGAAIAEAGPRLHALLGV